MEHDWFKQENVHIIIFTAEHLKLKRERKKMMVQHVEFFVRLGLRGLKAFWRSITGE